jgi:hypothetical protein
MRMHQTFLLLSGAKYRTVALMNKLAFMQNFVAQNVDGWANELSQHRVTLRAEDIFCLSAPDTPDEQTRFAGAILLADWLCYTKPEDRADAARLMATVKAFPPGLKLYATPETPVGYAAWYPVDKTVFDRLAQQPQKLTHRGQIAPVAASDYLYVFNYSVVPDLRGSQVAARLIKTLAADIAAQKPKGLSAVTVSDDGARVAKRFGMVHRGQMTHDGVPEDVYTT